MPSYAAAIREDMGKGTFSSEFAIALHMYQRMSFSRTKCQISVPSESTCKELAQTRGRQSERKGTPFQLDMLPAERTCMGHETSLLSCQHPYPMHFEHRFAVLLTFAVGWAS